jgi:hypothetical protein
MNQNNHPERSEGSSKIVGGRRRDSFMILRFAQDDFLARRSPVQPSATGAKQIGA